MTNKDEIEYELSMRYAPLKGNVVSRRTVEDLIGCIIEAPDLQQHANLGVNKQNTDRDEPYFMPLIQALAPSGGDSSARTGKIAFAIGKLGKCGFFQIHP
ncbi:hypothetical protein BA896_022120 [Janthinobacterium lividum]|uniref:Uncharacterized protein n=1 Tax=Janthinobacterium lividum TaxID=29581 RepID=A0A1E8PLH2_9BURK|nr:hypothetical protein BA896_022120 [Janthinobacterium lividum]